MKDFHSLDFYHAAIKSVDADACAIRQPNISGKNAQVFFADVGSDTYVYRFTDEYFIRRNNKISYLLALCDVPAPRTSVHCYMKTLFEKYKYCPDKTLQELIDSGISDSQIFNIYKSVLRVQYQISKIDISELSDVSNKYYSSLYSKRTHMQLPPIISHASSAIIFALSRCGNMRLFHNDVNPGNILVSPDNKISYLLDLDGISITSTGFSLIRTIQACPNLKINELLEFYADLTKQSLPTTRIIALFNTLQCAGMARRKFEQIFNITR